MSHFAVAVITKDKNKIDQILDPYWEDLEVEPYVTKTKEEIIEETRKFKIGLENKEIAGFTNEFVNMYLDAKTDEELYKLGKDKYYEYDENGNQLSTYNPNSKWDWYDIGGRFRNVLLTKIENNDTVEHNSYNEFFTGNHNRPAPVGFKYVNGAKIKDIEFKKMEEIDNEKFYTWALVDENDWYEQGKMGWWGMNDSTEETTKSFAEKFQEYINNPENQNKYIVIVDCHI